MGTPLTCHAVMAQLLAQGHLTSYVDDATFSPLLDLLERFPDLCVQRVLAHLDPIDRTFLAQAGSACRAAVVASGLRRAGGPTVDESERIVWRVTHLMSEFCTSVERLAWAKANSCPCGARTSALAARGGRLEVLQWARERGCPWDGWTCAYAASGGHLEVLKWAREHGCDWDKPSGVGACTCSRAARGGHLEVLQWVREHHCPWDVFTCYEAAARGHLEVLKWAREHGCPWSKLQCAAASNNHPETLAWVRAQLP